MIFLVEKIRQLISVAVIKKFPDTKCAIKVEYPAQYSNGDYSTNIALELGKATDENPRRVAEELLEIIKKPNWISKIEVAGPGFINFFLSEKFLTDFLDEIRNAGAVNGAANGAANGATSGATNYGASDAYKGKTVVSDTSNPNIAKPMGAHHLLSTIIGDSLTRIFAAAGYRVVRDNYLGDWGTQFGKLIYAYKTWGDEKTVKKNPIPELLKLYVKFHDEAERDGALEDAGRVEFKKLEEGNAENKKLWKWIVDLSMEEFQKLYKRLGVTFDLIHGESFYEDKMQEIIDEGIKKKIFVTGEGGALIAPFSHEKYPPCLIRKSDGATLYATRDLARVKYWERTWHPDLMVMVVDMAQTMHFQQFLEVSKMMKLTAARNLHISFGRMRFPEKRMSTRKGNIVLMEELLDEAEERAYKIVCEKNPELSEKRKKEVARQVGIGAVKYAILSQNRSTDITFTWDKILSLDGNSAPYLQYVYARGRSIMRRSKAKSGSANKSSYTLQQPQELTLARFLPRFPEIILRAAEEFKPNLIANYLYEVASAFNTFYQAVPVIQAPPNARETRLKLVEATTIVLKNGLALLGIETPEEM